MTYNPALDGLRAFAVVLVAMFHARASWGVGGYIGVDVFFVLSGYLITSLLLGELETSGRIHFSKFWRHRVLRLVPALAGMLVAYLLVAPLAWPMVTDHARQALVAALFVSDYGMAWWGVPGLLSHTWSLAVEMHFYLLWPALLTAVCRRWNSRERVSVLLTVYFLVTLLRWVCTIKGQGWQEVYYRTDTHASGLVLGAWLGAALRDEQWRKALDSIVPWLLWLPVAALLCLRNPWGDIWMQMWGFTIAEWASVAVILAVQRPSAQLAVMFSLSPFVWLGKMSYGVYLWHYPLFVWMRARYSWDTVLLWGLPISICLAAVSYYTIEKWAGRMRDGLAFRTRRKPA